jgi:hypothetical protein
MLPQSPSVVVGQRGDGGEMMSPSIDESLSRERHQESGREMMVRHPANPYPATATAGNEGELEKQLLNIAREYLAGVGLPDDPHADPPVEWLPINPSDRSEGVWDPRNSFWVECYTNPVSGSPQRPTNRTAVLLGRISSMNLRVRVVAHVRQDPGVSIAKIRITGFSTMLAPAKDDWYEPFPALELVQKGKLRAKASEKPPARRRESEDAALQEKIFPLDPASDRGLKEYAVVRPNRSSFPPSRLPLKGATGGPPKIEELLRLDGQVFTGQHAGRCALEAPQRPAPELHFRVMGAPLVNGDEPPDSTKTVPAKTLLRIKRTNDSAAVNAFLHARELFRRLTSYGFRPRQYFKFATLPLLIHYRSGLAPGPGKHGKIIDARADWKDRQEPQLDSKRKRLKPAEIEVKFALGDLDLSPERSPLGIACDPRVNWHEFSHALLMGTTGERELRFAHSGGDALAAILCDPRSKLVKAARFASFPWVQIPGRRHDREVTRGWGWSGSMYRRERFCVGPNGNDKNAYWAEQILSTTLFRIYRAIGGDTTRPGQPETPDELAREAAADYALYLIMRAYALLGPARFLPAKTPDQFVSALIDADIGTELFGHGDNQRVGGTVHKVIRWAFQQQGLYAKGDAANEAGEPEQVDIFIDQRPAADSSRGGYEPTSRNEVWHATDRAVSYNESDADPVSVEVRNCGSSAARGVKVRVWFKGAVPDNPELIRWDRSEWKEMKLASGSREREHVAVGQPRLFRFRWPDKKPAKPFAVLAEASAEADRSNLDPETRLPCALQPGSIMHLVACDNNLGLRIVT